MSKTRRLTGKALGRPAKYEKPFTRTYRVSKKHIERVSVLKGQLKCKSNSDVIEEAVIQLERLAKAGFFGSA